MSSLWDYHEKLHAEVDIHYDWKAINVELQANAPHWWSSSAIDAHFITLTASAKSTSHGRT